MRCKSFRRQAASRSNPRCILAKAGRHTGRLFPLGIGFFVTRMKAPCRSLVRFYSKRGTAERRIKEGEQGTSWTRLSRRLFRANPVRLQLSVPAHNLGT